jgi:hypothetical protein
MDTQPTWSQSTPVSNPYAPPDPNKPRPPQPQQPRPLGRQQRPVARAPQPPRPSLTPEQAKSVTSAVMLFGLLMLLTLLAGGLPVPWQVLAPVVGVGTLWYGFRTLMRVRKLRWPGMLSPMLVGGLLLTAMTTLGTTTQLTMFWDEQVAYQECREQAITIAAQERCEREWEAARGTQS